MIPSASVEFFVAVLFAVTLVLILLLMLFVRRVNRIRKAVAVLAENLHTGEDTLGQGDSDMAKASAMEVRETLAPMIEASKEAAEEFDRLIREKKRLTKDLNDALDAKIISINLLLSRAGTIQKNLEEQQAQIRQASTVPSQVSSVALKREPDVIDQQNQIIDMYYQNVEIDTIAERLSIPKGEVQLVIDLKEKFVAMEKTQ
ncbi:MAG TPA: hypothetical protein DHV36_08600 [Desulfobacteraceae bacterium]|nr:hypothetical protein [Desulfobacteraceae bacterium]